MRPIVKRWIGLFGSLLALAAGLLPLRAATFGTQVPLLGAPLDLVLDERRNQVYLVDYNNNAVQVYSIGGKQFLPPIPVGTQPVGGAISPDGAFLYVTNYGSSTLSVVDLGQNAVVRTVTTPAPPEGVAVGSDGRVVLTTLGQGAAGTLTNTLVIFDPASQSSQPFSAVQVPPPPPAAPTLPPTLGRAYLSFHSRLQTTPDGSLIIGMNTPTATTTVVFVYEVASGQILRSRIVPGFFTSLSISPDGSRFMAGLDLFDTATLNVLAQQNTANAPFTINGSFTLAQNVGGSVFAANGSVLYSAFNIPPVAQPSPPTATTLLISNPRNLGVTMGLQLPENILGKMVASSDGGALYAVSDSGLLVLPVGALGTFPILQPEKTVVRLSASQCDNSQAAASIAISNAGRSNLRYSVVSVAASAGLSVQAQGGQAPGRLAFTMASGVTRQLGSTLTSVTLQSQEAINIPPAIQVYQNWRNAETQSTTYPVETVPTVAEGLTDSLMDNSRHRLYIANSGKNRIEVFDTQQNVFLNPIEVGQLPHSMALGLDGRTLYVANSGGESVSMVDLDAGQQYDRIVFPPAASGVTAGASTPQAIAEGLSGLQMFALTATATGATPATGQLWSVQGKMAVRRPLSNAIGTLNVSAPATMVSTPNNGEILLLSGNGTAYLYDALSDNYVLSRTVMSAPLTSYYGVVGAGPGGGYFLANRAILNASLVPTAGFTGGSAAATPTPTPPGFIIGPGGIIIPIPGGAGGPGGGGAVAQTTSTLRNVAAVAPMNATAYVQLSTPAQASAAATPTGDARPLLEVVSVNSGSPVVSSQISEGAAQAAFANARVNLSGRLLALDAQGTNAYALTASGLTVVSLPTGRLAPISVNLGGVVQAASFKSPVAPGGLISIFGQNLGDNAVAGSLPLPTNLGGSCVTINNTGLPLIMTSPAQINAQLPPGLAAGNYSLIVRSTRAPSASTAVQVTVAAAAPGVFADPATGQAMLFHADMQLVDRDHPASRDETLVLFATGLPAAPGVNLAAGQPSPLSPLATTVAPRVFIGDPTISQSEMIVRWSGFTPGFVGLNQINIYVPGDRVRGDRLPVSIKVGNATSPTGPAAPVSYVQ